MIKPKLLTLAILSLAIHANAHTPESVAEAMMNLNAQPLRSQSTQRNYNDLWSRMRPAFRLSEVNAAIVRRHETYYATRAAYVNRTIERSRPYLYHILTEVEKRNMPTEIALLPFIESAFVTKAQSRVGASGLWQFMPATGRQYGLAQNHFYDSRHDIYAATDAALNYLEYLYRLFGDWHLALAAYNWGEGNVSRAISRAQSQGLTPNYENIRMPDETRNYVPKLLAVRNLIANPQAFNLTLPNIENKPYFQVVTINSPMDIQAITRLANISEAEFTALNPSSKVAVFLPENGQRKLLLPVGVVNQFESGLRNARPEALLSYDILHNENNSSLSDIAERTGISLDDLRRTNGLSRNANSISRLLVSKNSSAAARLALTTPSPSPQTTTPAVTPPPVIRLPEAQTAAINPPNAVVPPPNMTRNRLPEADSEDELMRLARTGNTPTPPALSPTSDTESAAADTDEPAALADSTAEAPDTFDAAAAVRASLAQTAESEPQQTAPARPVTRSVTRTINHRVGAGETLIQIARRYQTDVATLKRNNNLRSNTLRRGQTLKIVQQQTITVNARQAANANPRQSAAATRQNQNNNRQNTRTGRNREISYTVRNGDTLASIARRHNVSVADIKRQNRISGSRISPGQKLRIRND